ncbi:MAG: hypothetical protein AB8H79_11795 [Myxococcota bacterium]
MSQRAFAGGVGLVILGAVGLWIWQQQTNKAAREAERVNTDEASSLAHPPDDGAAPEKTGADTQAPVRACDLDKGSLRLEVRPDPGFGDAGMKPVVPVLRDHMPPRFLALVCPKIDCKMPRVMPATVWSAGPGDWSPVEVPIGITRRGKCLELSVESKANRVWPGATEGIVRWALVLGPSTHPPESMALRDSGAMVWMGDVVHAGVDGSPDVH